MRTKNVKYYITIGVLVVLVVMTGFCCHANIILKGSTLQEVEQNTSNERLLTDFSAEFRTILQNSPRSFYKEYAIDESFLLWLNANYGDHVIQQLAASIASQEMDDATWYDLTGNSIHVLWLMYCQTLNYSSYLLSDVVWLDCASDDVVTLDFIGDINFAEDWHTTQALDEQGGAFEQYISKEILEELSSADLAMANNEFTFSTRGTATEGKKYLFRADPLRISYYEKMGIDVVSLANNHTWDYGRDALMDTISTLEQTGIVHMGAGNNLKEARKIHYFVANGRKIAIVSATQIERYHQYTKEATADQAGVLKTLQPDIFVQTIEEAKQKSDYVIAYVHWGTEGNLYPDADERELAELFVKAGADVIIGGHSHRLQGVSYVENVPVFYSLGNFWFSTGDLYTTIAQVTIDRTGALSVRMLPCEQKDVTVRLLTEQEAVDGFYHYIADISSGIGIMENGTIQYIGKEPTQEVKDAFSYLSGQKYANHHGDVDLRGNGIDIVGNLK